MSAPTSPRHKRKKRSFLEKLSRAFAGKRERRDSSSDEDRSSGTNASPSKSQSRTPHTSPMMKTDVAKARDGGKYSHGERVESNAVVSSTDKGERTNESSGVERVEKQKNGASEIKREDFSIELPAQEERSRTSAGKSAGEAAGVSPAGSDKNYEAKKTFMQSVNVKTELISPVNVNLMVNEKLDKSFEGKKIDDDNLLIGKRDYKLETRDEEYLKKMELRVKDVDAKLLDKATKVPVDVNATKDLMSKLKKGAVRDASDSDSEDWTDSQSEISDDEREELDYGELYFTTGKYISYFFLQMERQAYDPNDVYSIIQYTNSKKSKRRNKKGENSSSGSTSPNIPSSLRRRLLHRRSADNLVVNSPTNSMRHSSPESIRSAPIPLKPRSTSHDALSKNRCHAIGQTDGASMDSLAKRSLLAAQVLNLIPAQKARERNFLHGRIAANSLLGPVELEKVLPNREVRIFIGTWNMNGQTPPKELNDFMLPSDIEIVPDILAIGTQESCSERGEWEAALQETLGPSHVLLTSTGLGTLHLALFLRRDLIWFCSVPEDDNFSTRPGTAFRTKGAVALALMLFGTSFLFVTAHLTAHQEKVKERVNDIKRIVRNLELPKDLPTRHKGKDVTQNFDCVFWCGDLNFRLAQPREEVIQWISDTSFPQQSPICLNKDQLRTILSEGAVLRGFEEAPITFPPTYKYDPGTQNFDTSSKQRTPAYTDRILFKGKSHPRGYIRRVSHESTASHKDGNIECLIYDSVPSICTSDHKPVWGVFKTTVRPGIDTIPLAAGLFNREVYLEGIRRRAAAMDDAHSPASACSLQ